MIQDRVGIEAMKIQEYAELEGKSILEIGCGNGRSTAVLARYARKAVAIDPDSGQLAVARVNVPGVDFRQGSGENLEFPDEAFDIVAFTFSLHHQDSTRALKEAHRVLRSGGQALVIEPSVEGEMHRFFRAFRNEDLRLAAARDSLRNSSFCLDKSETFSIEWIFDDNEDLYDYFFKHNNMARNSEYIGKMDELLGEKRTRRPILLEEIVIIFSLTKM